MGAPFKNTLGQKQHKLIYEFSGSRNLNTNPIDVTGLDGDKWDYMVEVEGVASSNTDCYYRLNLDSASNYRDYYMRGTGSSALLTRQLVEQAGDGWQ